MKYLWLLAVAALAATPKQACGQEIEQRKELMQQAKALYQAEDFSKLDSLLNDYRISKERTSSGLWKFTFATLGVESLNDASSENGTWSQVEERALRWRNANPRSPYASVNLADVIVGHAWSIRGGSYAADVPKSAWQPFKSELARARTILEGSRPFASVNPHWYEESIVIAKADDRARADVDALFEEGTDREPGYYQTYFAMVNYLLPKWNGDLHQVETFARKSADKTRSFEGESLYARIYWSASQTDFKNAIFTTSFARWSKLDAGFQDIIARYPDQWNINNYARFACLIGDVDTALKLMEQVGQPIPEAWEPPSLFYQCRERVGIRTL